VETDRLILALVQSKNESADDVLLECLRLGSEEEKPIVLAALIKRATVRGLRGVIAQYDSLSEPLQRRILDSVRDMHHALRECGRSDDPALRIATLKLIALGRQGKLAFVLSENLRNEQDEVSKAAIEALVALARWVSIQTKWLQKGEYSSHSPDPSISTTPSAASKEATPHPTPAEHTPADAAVPASIDLSALTRPVATTDATAVYNELLAQRPEIETAVARAIDLSRGRYGPGLLRAALLLCDWPGSKTLAILQSAKHGGQTVMVRRLEQAPASENVAAFLLASSHGQLRAHFGSAFAHINEGPVLDALLRKSHWLRDSQLQLCMHQVTRGAWWGESELLEDIARRDPPQAAKIGDWLCASGAHDVVQDDRMERLRFRAESSVLARLHLLRLVSMRRRGSSVQLIKTFLSDPDERLARMAAREMIRRRPPEYENLLLTRMATAPASVRRIIGRALGNLGFEQFWNRFDQLDRDTRRNAGKAMLKILPDSVIRLRQRLENGAVERRLKALEMAADLDLVSPLRVTLIKLTEHTNPKVRSKAVGVLALSPESADNLLLDRVLSDTDPRVRANAIEILEAMKNPEFLPLLTEKAKSGHSRERANSIKALHKMRQGPAADALQEMLRDQRPDHRVSAMWALKQMGFWRLLGEVGRLAKEDNNIRVRRYALAVLKGVADMVQKQREKAG